MLDLFAFACGNDWALLNDVEQWLKVEAGKVRRERAEASR